MKYFSFQGNDFEEKIISGLKSTGSNKTKAEEHLFAGYSHLITSGMRKYSISEDDSFNAYSDTVLDVIHSIVSGTFQRRSSLDTYLHRVFYNKCIDIIRKRTTRKSSVYGTISIDSLEPFLSDTSMSVIEKLVNESEMQQLTQKMNQLSENNRKLIMLSAAGYTDKEIAMVMSFKSIDVVKVTRLRCIKKLRRMFKEKENVSVSI